MEISQFTTALIGDSHDNLSSRLFVKSLSTAAAAAPAEEEEEDGVIDPQTRRPYLPQSPPLCKLLLGLLWQKSPINTLAPTSISNYWGCV